MSEVPAYNKGKSFDTFTEEIKTISVEAARLCGANTLYLKDAQSNLFNQTKGKGETVTLKMMVEELERLQEKKQPN